MPRRVVWVGAVKRNWRGHASRAQFYFEQGSIALQQLKQALYASAAIKIILELSVMTAILITPFVFLVMLLWGIFWVRHGWYRHMQEVAYTDAAVTPLSMWGMHMTVRLYEHLGIPMNNLDLTKLPKEMHDVLASRKD